ncbi:MAG: hypothetical protein A2293_07980 [Elusimicrobia bacterium RIFOXYB2_FULL_49_7]|nr:MAG: hypothetical protein A2293_07980 [Elusimicrobia bacterium RIFOXYB2_FULL_49_7]
MKFSGKKLEAARREKEFSQEVLAKKLGVVRQTIMYWEKGTFAPDKAAQDKLSNILDKPASYFVEEEKAEKQVIPISEENIIRLPLVAKIPAGYPEFSEDEILEYIELPRFITRGAKYMIQCAGDSMEPEMRIGDYCLIRPESEVINGKIMVMETPAGYQIKRVVKRDGHVELHSDNKKYKVMKAKDVRVVGQVVKIIKNAE